MDSRLQERTWRNSPWAVVIGFPVFVLLGIAFFILPRSNDQHAPAQACRGNLSQIELAKKVWSEDEHKSTNDVPTESDLYGTNTLLRQALVCPVGGIYTIGFVAEKPRCSIPGHTI